MLVENLMSYTQYLYIFSDLFTVYALIVRLQFSVVNGICKIGKLF